VLLLSSLASFQVAVRATQRGMAQTRWGTCAFDASVRGSAATGGAAAPPRMSLPRNMRRGRRQEWAARPPTRTLMPPARGGSRRYGFWPFGGTSPSRHPPTTRQRCLRWRRRARARASGSSVCSCLFLWPDFGWRGARRDGAWRSRGGGPAFLVSLRGGRR